MHVRHIFLLLSHCGSVTRLRRQSITPGILTEFRCNVWKQKALFSDLLNLSLSPSRIMTNSSVFAFFCCSNAFENCVRLLQYPKIDRLLRSMPNCSYTLRRSWRWHHYLYGDIQNHENPQLELRINPCNINPLTSPTPRGEFWESHNLRTILMGLLDNMDYFSPIHAKITEIGIVDTHTTYRVYRLMIYYTDIT